MAGSSQGSAGGRMRESRSDKACSVALADSRRSLTRAPGPYKPVGITRCPRGGRTGNGGEY